MEENREEVMYLVEKVGVDPEEARHRLLDDDLWLLPAEQRVGPDPSQAVEMWEQAAHILESMSEVAGHIKPAVEQALWDATERAREARRRAVERIDAV